LHSHSHPFPLETEGSLRVQSSDRGTIDPRRTRKLNGASNGRSPRQTFPNDPKDAIATGRFVGRLRQRRENVGLSRGDVAERSGLDKATLSRLENEWYPNPTLNTLARYARGIGKRLVLDLED
jgi:DNA-binding XRE family transcriptional regulator